MTEMELDGVSLDDVIKRKGINRRGANKGGGRQRIDGGLQKPGKRNPKMWDNDKFRELESGGRQRRAKFGGGGGGGLNSNVKAICRLSNLPFNVTQQDLNDLFEGHRASKITLNHDFRGRSLGTAEIHGQANAIQRLAGEFKNVEIDGRPLQITVVGAGIGGGISSGGGIQSRLRRPGGGDRRSGGNDRRRSGGGGQTKGDEPRKKLTAEELDRELDEYMQGKA